MQLTTPVSNPPSSVSISHKSRLMFVGSCFAENISSFFINAKFQCLVNPSGIVYNPLSLSRLFSQLTANKIYSDSDFFQLNGLYSCYDFHGSFSRADVGEAVSVANSSMNYARNYLKTCDVLFITLGTAFVYFLAEDQLTAVSNCHKQPSSTFQRRLISVDEVAEALQKIVSLAATYNKDMRIVFTVSPIRHMKDGAHGNRISKSSLFLGIEKVLAANEHCEYFPSYEILEDELRDYRFYADDMVHPSQLAEKIIWQRIQETYFSEQVRRDVSAVEKYMNAVHHRIQNPDSLETASFCQKNLSLAFDLEDRIEGLDLSAEKKYFKSFIFF